MFSVFAAAFIAGVITYIFHPKVHVSSVIASAVGVFGVVLFGGVAYLLHTIGLYVYAIPVALMAAYMLYVLIPCLWEAIQDIRASL